MILHYLKVALRNLRKNKTQHLISALCLAIGILTFSFMLCFVYTVGEEEEYIGGERAMRLMISKKDFAGDVPCVEEDFRALKSQTSGMLEGWAVFSYEAEMEVEVVEKDGRETPYKVTYKVATPATFPFWKLPLLYGSRLPEREDEIIVSASFARRMAGSENPVGRIVRLASLTPANGITDYRIVNVVAEKEKGGSPRTECWFPLEMKPRTWLQMYALSKEGVSSESLEKYLAGISWVRGDGTMIVEASSLKEMAENRNTDLVQFFLLFISSLILVSGLINFLKFTFQQFYVRQRELALRKCVGSGSKGLFLLLFFEVFIMLTIAWFLSLLMGEVVMPLARTWLPAEHIFWLSASAVYRLHILVYLGTLLLCIPLLLIPVWRVRKVSLIRLIPVTGGKHVFRSLMIGIQLVVCIFFLGAMMVVHLSYAELFGKTYAPLSPAEEERCLSLSVNSERMRQNWDGEEYLYYKGKLALFVINYKTTYMTEMDYNKYKLLTLESIKSIYINEDIGTMLRYADPMISPLEIDKIYGCAVLIETYPEGEIPAKAGKGVRKTWLEGYSTPETFYEPDYSVLPKEPDYRRTLYWNPALLPDSTGHATVRFYNNSRCRRPRITVETLTEEGKIGVLNE